MEPSSKNQPEGWDAIEQLAESGDNRLAQAFRRCFNTADGIAVLEHLQDKTRGVLASTVPDSVLRDLEGQRRVVQYIEAMIARGAME